MGQRCDKFVHKFAIVDISRRYEYDPLEYKIRFNRPNRNKKYVRSIILDYIMICIIGGLAGLFSLLPPPDLQFRLDDPDISYSDLDEIVPTFWPGILVMIILPFVLLLLSSVLLARTVRDIHHCVLGFLTSIVLTFLITSFFWYAVGGLRPRFLAVCKPDLTQVREPTPGIPVVYYTREICTEDKDDIYFNMRAFPSGHASMSFSTWGFLAIYLGGKFKPYDNFSHYWKFLIIAPPIFVAGWVAYSRYVDNSHFLYQVHGGITIGILTAIFAYAFNFHSFFGRYSHKHIEIAWNLDEDKVLQVLQRLRLVRIIPDAAPTPNYVPPPPPMVPPQPPIMEPTTSQTV